MKIARGRQVAYMPPFSFQYLVYEQLKGYHLPAVSS